MTRLKQVLLPSLFCIGLLGGCERAETPPGGLPTAASPPQRAPVPPAIADARDDVAAAQAELMRSQAEGAEQVRIEQIELAYRVAMRKCAALRGEERGQCEMRAAQNRDLDLARARTGREAIEERAEQVQP